MSSHPVPAWDGRSLADLMALDASGETSLRTRCGDANAHGRSYGGQILGQALIAAARTAPAGRACTAMQFMFPQGTLWDQALDLQVTPLQGGKRCTSRHVRGVQRESRFRLRAVCRAGARSPRHAGRERHARMLDGAAQLTPTQA